MGPVNIDSALPGAAGTGAPVGQGRKLASAGREALAANTVFSRRPKTAPHRMIPRLHLVAPVLVALGLAACVSAPERVAVPEPLVQTTQLPGFENIRFWGDVLADDQVARTELALDDIRNNRTADTDSPEEIAILALSGGGGHGAFGAGLLNGWSEHGDRPEFRVVTGVSTGAIIAPLAFLGPAYDDTLRAAYTEIGPGDIYTPAILSNLVSGPALASAEPLTALIRSYTDEDLLAQVAREHARGRRLLVATTDIDTGRPVIWDMGAIASQGGPGALELFRRIMLASAAIPGMFPPVEIEVAVNGVNYRELHIDGGATTQVFAYQPQIELGQILQDAGIEAELSLFIIRNGRQNPPYEAVEPVWYRIMERSLDVLLTHQGNADIARLYWMSQRDGLTFNLAMIPDDFPCHPDNQFETGYMTALYAFGYDAGRNGYQWADNPFDGAVPSANLAHCPTEDAPDSPSPEAPPPG